MTSSSTLSKTRGQTVFSGFFFAYFACYGVVLPFLPYWMVSRGLDASQAALILSSAFISKVFFGMGVGALADATGHKKRWILALSVVTLVGFSVFVQVQTFWPMLLTWFVVGALQTSHIPMVDGLAIATARIGKLNYSSARLWGSVAFIVSSTLSGLYIAAYTIEAFPALLLVLAAAVVVSVLPLPDLRPQSKPQRKLAFLELFKLPGFIAVVVVGALVQASHGALYAIGTLHWLNTGISESVIGLLWAQGVVAEVMLFAFGFWLMRKMGVRGLLWLAVVGGSIRWIVMGFPIDIAGLFGLQMLHAFTFAATHLAMTQYITHKVPDQLTASAQTFYDALAMGAFMGVTMTLAGIFYNVMEGQVFWLMALLSIAAGLVLGRSNSN
ncbi:MAG: MFS transporter [Oceanospirillaceae bacterium]|jgi:PPP family 3-phenylpropionic acid transporter|nr:MFS transporter [Oceanospirillaceae bacterium]MBT4443830.1 MFS transporter [Oceanospirillaceae bacterium]MBT6078443.1 MFS transporter [Oceanospirillaceae bacterium]MBT7329462.1 MFS transporter [Oceanospirillaceae bacterium]